MDECGICETALDWCGFPAVLLLKAHLNLSDSASWRNSSSGWRHGARSNSEQVLAAAFADSVEQMRDALVDSIADGFPAELISARWQQFGLALDRDYTYVRFDCCARRSNANVEAFVHVISLRACRAPWRLGCLPLPYLPPPPPPPPCAACRISHLQLRFHAYSSMRGCRPRPSCMIKARRCSAHSCYLKAVYASNDCTRRRLNSTTRPPLHSTLSKQHKTAVTCCEMGWTSTSLVSSTVFQCTHRTRGHAAVMVSALKTRPRIKTAGRIAS